MQLNPYVLLILNNNLVNDLVECYVIYNDHNIFLLGLNLDYIRNNLVNQIYFFAILNTQLHIVTNCPGLYLLRVPDVVCDFIYNHITLQLVHLP